MNPLDFQHSRSLEAADLSAQMTALQLQDDLHPVVHRSLAADEPVQHESPFPSSDRHFEKLDWFSRFQPSSSAALKVSTPTTFGVVVEEQVDKKQGFRRRLLPRPAVLSPNSHFSCSAQPDAVFLSIIDGIREYGDCQMIVDNSTYNIRGVVFRPQRASFHVTLFEPLHSEQSAFEIEIRHSEGDSMSFWLLYGHVLKRIASQTTVPRVTSEVEVMPLPPGWEHKPTVDSDSIVHLCTMASSHLCDVAEEGAAALVVSSRHEGNVPLLREHFTELSSLCLSKDLEVRRCAATVLSRICSGWAECPPSQLKRVLDSLHALDTSPTGATADDLIASELRLQQQKLDTILMQLS